MRHCSKIKILLLDEYELLNKKFKCMAQEFRETRQSKIETCAEYWNFLFAVRFWYAQYRNLIFN